MFEVRQFGDKFKVFDSSTGTCVVFSSDRHVANKYASSTLRLCGFEGVIPAFFVSGLSVDLDRKKI